ncbi:nitroreductase family protein [Mediterraneibacter faecis]|uniref:nitroreductase family protein n=1 Tax=Mediterraneibacter faecis TaxID=592978 RepID=UPI0022DEDC64|nr:nitroreductase family protein [Mediterraneibacter faecis]
MIKEIENRRSIRKYKRHEISKEIIEDIIYSATLAPSAKNRQPWKFIVYQGEEKSKLVDVMHQGIKLEKITHKLMPEWAFAIPDAENTVRVMEEAPCLIAVLNTNQKTPFDSIEDEKRIVEICDSLSIGAAIENMILTATNYGLGTLWIANTCFAYNELIDFIETDSQLTGIVAIGFANETPAKRPRKPVADIVEYR